MRMKLLVVIGLAMMFGALATVGGLEGAARLVAPEQLDDSCRIRGNHGLSFKPDCVSAPMKQFEGEWMRDTTNECGYRTAESCRARAPEQLRVAVIGTSIADGYFVDYPQTWAARASALLSRTCHRRVDFQNLSFAGTVENTVPMWHRIPEQMPAALALKPDAIVIILDLWDFAHYNSSVDLAPVVPSGPETPRSRFAMLTELKDAALEDSRAIRLAKSWVARDPAAYAISYARTGFEVGSFQEPLPPLWRFRLSIASATLDRIGLQAKKANVPWIVLLMPSYGQSVLASATSSISHTMFAFNNELGAAVEAKGGRFYDLTRDLRGRPRLADYYYVVNGHPSGLGHKVIAERAVQMLRADAPPFRKCAA